MYVTGGLPGAASGPKNPDIGVSDEFGSSPGLKDDRHPSEPPIMMERQPAGTGIGHE
jgi:hypothetical protein